MSLAAYALTDYATVAGELGLSGTTDQTLIERLINVASSRLQTYCNRLLTYQSGYVESLASAGGPILTLGRPPIVSITSIYLQSGTLLVDSTEYEVHSADAGLVYRAAGWPSTGLLRPDLNFMRQVQPGTEEKTITATYNGGYLTGPQVAATGAYPGQTRTLPDELEEACIIAVKAFYRARRRDPNVKSESLLGATVTYGGSGMPSDAEALAFPYVRIV